MKKTISFFKYWYAPINVNNFIPIFKHTKNVQGYVYTRNWYVNWLVYTLLFRITKYSNENETVNIAHNKNIIKYKLI